MGTPRRTAKKVKTKESAPAELATIASVAPIAEETTPLYLRLNKEERTRFEAAWGRTRMRYFSDWAREMLWQASEPPKG